MNFWGFVDKQTELALWENRTTPGLKGRPHGRSAAFMCSADRIR